MKKVASSFFLLVVSPFFWAGSCEKKACSEEVMCTEIFSMVTVQVTDQNGDAVLLDEVYTIRGNNAETIRPDQQAGGVYVVLDDSYRKKLENQKDDFRFIGMKEGKKVIEEVYSIAADCCHIQKISGNESIKR